MKTEFWRMGADPVPVAEIGRIARELEDSGWDGLAVGEAHGILPDPYATLAVAAEATSTLKVGTAVAVPLRHPILAADAMTTVQGISRGRARFSVGRGDGAVKVLQQKPMPVAKFEEYIRRLQGFLRREDVEIDGSVSSMARLMDIDPSLDIESLRSTSPRRDRGRSSWPRARRTRSASRWAPTRSGCGVRSTSPGTRAPRPAATSTSSASAATCRWRSSTRMTRAGSEAIRGVTLTHARFSGFEARPTEDVTSTEHRSTVTRSRRWRRCCGTRGAE